MNLCRRTRTELAGAWRSLRYDLGRRETVPDGVEQHDVTSTGMSTFGIALDDPRTSYEEFGRPPRRMVAVAVFAALTIAGAAGSYFAIVNGLGSLLREKPPAATAYPLAAADPPGDAGSTARMGRGAPPERAVPVPAGPGTAATAVPPAAAPPNARVLPEPRRTTPERAVRPSRTSCACPAPPVPTPTAPSTSPSASASPSPTPTGSGAANPSVSPEPSASSGRWDETRRKRPRGGY